MRTSFFGIAKSARDERIARLLKLVGMDRSSGLQLRKFSRGMLQRRRPGPGPDQRPSRSSSSTSRSAASIRSAAKEIPTTSSSISSREGKTVLFTSHILQDIELICDRVAIIVGGRILSQGKLTDLVSEKVLFTEVTVSGVEVRASWPRSAKA